MTAFRCSDGVVRVVLDLRTDLDPAKVFLDLERYIGEQMAAEVLEGSGVKLMRKRIARAEMEEEYGAVGSD